MSHESRKVSKLAKRPKNSSTENLYFIAGSSELASGAGAGACPIQISHTCVFIFISINGIFELIYFTQSAIRPVDTNCYLI